MIQTRQEPNYYSRLHKVHVSFKNTILGIRLPNKSYGSEISIE